MKSCDIKEGYLYQDYSKRGHCANGTFVAKEFSGVMHISDTYWNSSKNWIKVSDDYVENFVEILKLDEWKLTDYYGVKRYKDEDIIQTHYTQCSGRNLGTTDYFLRIGAEQDCNYVKKLLEDEIRYTRNKLIDMERQLLELESGELDVRHVWLG